MNKLMEIVHPGEDHLLKFFEGSESVALSQTCHKCMQPVSGEYYYKCTIEGCDEYYLHKECVELKDLPQINHPLHPQHPLAVHYNYPCEKSFVCSFCGETEKSREFYQCSDDECDFYLNTTCAIDFKTRPELKDLPQIHYPLHPQHPLALHYNYPFDSDNIDSDSTMCALCEFYLHGDHHCPTFNLDLKCYTQFKPTLKHEAHEHPLGYIWKIYDDNVRCYACNTPFTSTYNSFCCLTCNFNIHSGCLALPNTVNYYDHVHPLTLTTSFMEDGDPTTYYCDICEKRRDPDHGIYFCKECTFIAHFECALSLSNTEKEARADAPWRQKIEEDNHRTDEEEDITLTNEKDSLEIFDQLNVEVEKLGEVIQQLIKKREGEQLAEKIQEFDERHTKTENMLRRLKQSVRGTK